MPNKANSEILSDLETLQQATLASEIIQQSATGKAYLSVVLSSSIAVQDATDQLRSTGVLALSAMGAGVAKLIESGDTEAFNATIQGINTLLDQSTEQFSKVATAASKAVSEFTPKS